MNDLITAIVSVSPNLDLANDDSSEITEEQFASIFAALGFFRDLSTEQVLYDDLVNLCIPAGTNRLYITTRNVKVIVLAIFNIH